MKRIGLRRVFPWLSYAIRWVLVQQMRSDRILARMPPEERGRCLAHLAAMDRMAGLI
jgi:hypothetical protein